MGDSAIHAAAGALGGCISMVCPGACHPLTTGYDLVSIVMVMYCGDRDRRSTDPEARS